MLNLQVLSVRRLEKEVWLDLARIYSDLESWPDAEICINKAKATKFITPRDWHTKGLKGNFCALPLKWIRQYIPQ